MTQICPSLTIIVLNTKFWIKQSNGTEAVRIFMHLNIIIISTRAEISGSIDGVSISTSFVQFWLVSVLTSNKFSSLDESRPRHPRKDLYQVLLGVYLCQRWRVEFKGIMQPVVFMIFFSYFVTPQKCTMSEGVFYTCALHCVFASFL